MKMFNFISLKNVLSFWLKEKQVDGLRIDALANLYENKFFENEPLIPGVDAKVIISLSYSILLDSNVYHLI